MQLTFNVPDALTFLSRFNYKLLTIQLLIPEGKKLPKIPGKVLWNKKKGSSTAVLEGILSDEPNAQILKDLYLLQHQGLGVFFMVNEGDGIIYPPAETPRSITSVKTLKSLFIDTDKGDAAKILTYLKAKDTLPHLITQTSNGRYHIYLLIEDTDKGSGLERWVAIQKHFYSMDIGYDQSMHDPSKLLRVPGFYHTKKEPYYQVRIERNFDHPKFKLEELYDLYSPDFSIHTDDSNTAGNSISYQFPKQKVVEGGRHAELVSYMRHVSNSCHGVEDLLSAGVGHCVLHLEKPEEFLPGGLRYSELQKIVKDVRGYAAYEAASKNGLITPIEVTSESGNSAVTGKSYLNPEEIFKEFTLPDSFYCGAPGLTGEIVSYINKNAWYTATPMYLANTICALGTLKARTVRTELGHAPGNYFMCFAPTGSGKNYAQEVFSHTFQDMGILGLITNKIRSEQGLYRFLQENNGVGFCLLDEVETFLTTLQDIKTPPYLRQCRDALLELYTSTNKHFHTGVTGDKKIKSSSMFGPVLNITAHGVPNTLIQAFNQKAVGDGFFQRFVILTHMGSDEPNLSASPAKALNGYFKESMRDMVMTAKLSAESVMLESLNITQELETFDGLTEPTKEDKKIQKELKKKLSDLKEAASNDVEKIKLKFSGAGLTLYNAFDRDMFALRRKETRAFSGLEGVFTRGAEQVGRMCAAMAEPDPQKEISAELVGFCVELVKSRVNALYAFCKETFSDVKTATVSGVSLAKDMDALVRYIAKKAASTGATEVAYRDIMRGFHVRDKRRLEEILSGCLETGVLLCETKVPIHGGPQGRFFSLR